MKRYKIEYFLGDRSKPHCLIELCKLEKCCGKYIYFFDDGIKSSQVTYKNDLLNRIEEEIVDNKKWYFRNWKKNKEQGIEIKFKL